MLVTVQVKLLVPELWSPTCCLICSLSHCVDSETFSVRKKGVGCALAWVALARDSESDYPFYPVGQFRWICAGH